MRGIGGVGGRLYSVIGFRVHWAATKCQMFSMILDQIQSNANFFQR